MSKVKENGDSQIGSNSLVFGRKARMKAQIIGRRAKIKNANIIVTPATCFGPVACLGICDPRIGARNIETDDRGEKEQEYGNRRTVGHIRRLEGLDEGVVIRGLRRTARTTVGHYED